jgi:hypothetical protein
MVFHSSFFVILSAAKNPAARPHAVLLVDSSLALRMTEKNGNAAGGCVQPLRYE